MPIVLRKVWGTGTLCGQNEEPQCYITRCAELLTGFKWLIQDSNPKRNGLCKDKFLKEETTRRIFPMALRTTSLLIFRCCTCFKTNFRSNYKRNCANVYTLRTCLGESSGAAGWSPTLQNKRSRVRFRMLLLKFLIELILPATLWSCGRLYP